MADLAVPRNTPHRMSSKYDKIVGVVVAAGQTLQHGTIGGLDADTKAAKPGAGVYPVGRVSCLNGVSATEGETVDLEQGSFSWDLDTGESLPAIGALVYAKDNHTVSVNAGEGQAFATYEGTFDGLPFFESDYGARVDAT
jgi:hypothetical protein